MTFKQCAEAYFAAHEDGWSNVKWRSQFTNTLRDYAYPIIGSVSVAAIDEALVLKVLTPIWKDKPRPRGASNRIAAVLDYRLPPVFALGQIRRAGKATLSICSRHPTKSHGSSITPRCLTPRSRPSSRASERKLASSARPGISDPYRRPHWRGGGATWDEIDFETKTGPSRRQG